MTTSSSVSSNLHNDGKRMHTTNTPHMVFGSPSMRTRSTPRVLFIIDTSLLSVSNTDTATPTNVIESIMKCLVQTLVYLSRYVDSRIQWTYRLYNPMTQQWIQPKEMSTSLGLTSTRLHDTSSELKPATKESIDVLCRTLASICSTTTTTTTTEASSFVDGWSDCIRQIPHHTIQWNESSVHDHFQTPVHPTRHRDPRQLVKNYAYIIGQLPMNKEQLCQMDPQSLMASNSMTSLDKYTRDTWIHTMTGNHHDTTRHQLVYEERISLNWWLIPLVDTNIQCPTMTRLVKQQWNTILCHYSGRLLDTTQSQLIQTILPFSAYYRHYRVRELDRSYAEKDRKRIDEMKRKTRLFQLSWCPTSSVDDISTQSITLSFYAMKEDPSLSMMKHPCNGHLIIKQRIELSYIDWYRVMTSNRNKFNSALICTTTDTIEDTEHHSWYYHMIQQLKQTQQCALVCVTSMQATDNELNDTTSYALLVALTDTIAGFHYISNDYYELLQKQITDPNTTSNNTDCYKWIFQPWMIEYWWGECVVDDTPRVHRWLQSTMKPCNTTLNNVSSMTSKLTLNEQPLQRHQLDYILGCIEHRQRILVDKSKNALVESNENIPNNEEEAMQQLIRHYYMTLYLIENDKEQSTNTLSFVSELRRIRELFKQKEWSIERLHTWINASIMTVDGLTRRMALLSNRYRAIKNGDNICEDELTIDVHEQPYIEQILQQTSTPSWTWLKLRSVELQIVLLLESVMLRTDTIEQLKIETKDQERMQQWVDKLCIWASFVDYSSMMSGNNTSAISSGIHQNTTDPLILLHDGLMTSYGEQLQPLLQILHQTYEHDDKEKRDDTLTSTLGKRTRSTTSTRAMSLLSKARSKQRLDNSSSLSSSSSLSITQSVSPIPRRRRRRHDPDCIPERHGVNTGRFPFHHRQVYLDPKVHLSKTEKRPSSTRTRRLSSASATSNESSATSFLSKRSMDALPISATTSTDNSIVGTPCSRRTRDCLVPESPATAHYHRNEQWEQDQRASSSSSSSSTTAEPSHLSHQQRQQQHDIMTTPRHQRRAPWLLSKTPQKHNAYQEDDDDDTLLQQLLSSPSNYRRSGGNRLSSNRIHFDSPTSMRSQTLVIQETPVKRSGRLIDLLALANSNTEQDSTTSNHCNNNNSKNT